MYADPRATTHTIDLLFNLLRKNYSFKQNWLQFIFVVEAAALKKNSCFEEKTNMKNLYTISKLLRLILR